MSIETSLILYLFLSMRVRVFPECYRASKQLRYACVLFVYIRLLPGEREEKVTNTRKIAKTESKAAKVRELEGDW